MKEVIREFGPAGTKLSYVSQKGRTVLRNISLEDSDWLVRKLETMGVWEDPCNRIYL